MTALEGGPLPIAATVVAYPAGAAGEEEEARDYYATHPFDLDDRRLVLAAGLVHAPPRPPSYWATPTSAAARLRQARAVRRDELRRRAPGNASGPVDAFLALAAAAGGRARARHPARRRRASGCARSGRSRWPRSGCATSGSATASDASGGRRRSGTPAPRCRANRRRVSRQISRCGATGAWRTAPSAPTPGPRCSAHGTSATTLPKRDVLLEVLLVELVPVAPASAARWRIAIASVSSWARCRRQALPRRDQPYGERRAGVVVGVPAQPGEARGAGLEQRVDLARARPPSRRSVARVLVVVPRSSSAGQSPASSPVWWWCSASAKSSQRSASSLPGRPVLDRGVPAPPRRTRPGHAGRRGASRTSSYMSTGPVRGRGLAGQPELRGPGRRWVVVRHRGSPLEWRGAWCGWSHAGRRAGRDGCAGAASRSVTSTRRRAAAGRARRASTSSSGRAATSSPGTRTIRTTVASRRSRRPCRRRALDHDVDLGGEAEEDGDHDRGGGGDHPAGRRRGRGRRCRAASPVSSQSSRIRESRNTS